GSRSRLGQSRDRARVDVGAETTPGCAIGRECLERPSTARTDRVTTPSRLACKGSLDWGRYLGASMKTLRPDPRESPRSRRGEAGWLDRAVFGAGVLAAAGVLSHRWAIAAA